MRQEEARKEFLDAYYMEEVKKAERQARVAGAAMPIRPSSYLLGGLFSCMAVFHFLDLQYGEGGGQQKFTLNFLVNLGNLEHFYFWTPTCSHTFKLLERV